MRRPLPAAHIAAYGLPMLAFGYTGGLMSFYFVKFSTDVLLIAPATIGLIFGVSRLWDAIFDLPVGHLCDHTRTRFGTRRPWMAASILPTSVFFVAMWSPPQSIDGTALVLWVGAAILLFHSAQTAFSVPHLALGSELSGDPHERTRAFAARLLFETLGLFAALGAVYLLEGSLSPRSTAYEVALWGAIGGTALTALCIVMQKEHRAIRAHTSDRWWQSYASVWRNQRARMLLIASFVELIGISSLATLLPYLSQYILNTPGYTAHYLLCFFLPFALSIPLWPWISHRFGKRETWIAATVVKGLGFGACFFLSEGDWVQIVAIVAVVGIADGAARTIGPSLYADVIEDGGADEHGRSGAYFGAWHLAMKAAMAVSVALVGFAMQAAGFQPNVEQSPQSELMLRTLSSVFPLLFCLGAALVVTRSGRRQGRVAAEIGAAAIAEGVPRGA